MTDEQPKQTRADKFAARLKTNQPAEFDPALNFFVYGRTGVGKTTLVKTLKPDCIEHDANCLLLNNDKGDQSIQSAIHDSAPRRWLYAETINQYQEVVDAYMYLRDYDHDFRWVVLDDTTRMAEMLLVECKKKHGDDVWGAYGDLNERFRTLLRSFRDLDVNLLFLAREDTEKTPTTAAFPGKALGSGNDGSSVLHEFDFAWRQVREQAEDGTSRYYLQTTGGSDVEAKSRDEFGVLDVEESPDLSALRNRLVESVRERV